MRDGFIFYRSFAEALSRVDAETKAQVLDALCLFALDGEEVDLDGVAGALFSLMRPQVEANNKKYQNGCKGGRPRTEAEPNENQNETKMKPSEKQARTKAEPKEKDKDKEKEKVKEKDKDVICAELADVAAIILADGSEWRPSKTMYDSFVQAFPGVDVKAEFAKMRAWSEANPKNRKTWAGASRFANSWLSREQDRPRQQAKKQDQKQSRYDIPAIEEALLWR